MKRIVSLVLIASTFAYANEINTAWNLLQKGDYSNAKPLLEKVCKEGDAPSCDALGQMNEKGITMPVDLKKAMKYYKQACDVNFSMGCINQGFLHAYFDTANDDKMALKLFDKACKLGDQLGCEHYESYHRHVEKKR